MITLLRFKSSIKFKIEIAEDEVKRQLNGELMEDSFNDESFNPSYDF